MASLNTLRTKGGIIVTVVIFLALLAFIVGDIFSSGSSLMNSRRMRVGKIQRQNISYVDFLNESEYLSSIYRMMWGKDSFSAQEQEMIYDMAWEQLIMQNSYAPGFDQLGLTVSEAEQIDMVDGVYLSPVITTSFVNPSTGLFDPQMMKTFMGRVNNNDGSYALWSFLRSQMAQQRIISKYSALVANAFNANALEVAQGVSAENNTFTASIVGKDYFSIPDSLVNVSSADIRKYYDQHKKAFKQDLACDIEYVVFDVMPSDADYQNAKQTVDEIAAEFARSESPMQYAALNSQSRPDSRYYRRDQLNDAIATAVFDGDANTVYGPVLNGDEYTISRLADKRLRPDTLGAKHIFLSADSRALADSLATALRGGADFATVAREYSLDTNSVGGDLGRFTPEQAPEEFVNAIIDAKVGDIVTVKTPAGIQIVQLTYKTTPVLKAQIATVTYKVDPSEETIQTAYRRASDFVSAANNTAAGFAQAVNDEALSKRTVRLRNSDRAINGVDNSKEIVRWAFNAKKGEVSPILDINGDYYVAALVDVKEEGTAPLEQVSAQISQRLLNEAKAKIIAEQLAGNTIDAVAAAAGNEVKVAENVKRTAFYLPNVGVEPQLIGAIAAAQPNVLSQPVEGVNGVYRFVVTDVQTSDNTSAESEKVKLDNNALVYINERLMQALVEESNVVDMRVKFF